MLEKFSSRLEYGNFWLVMARGKIFVARLGPKNLGSGLKK